MNGKGLETPVMLLECELHWSKDSPSIFLASSQTVPCPLGGFYTHARCSSSARSRWSYGKIGECEWSTYLTAEIACPNSWNTPLIVSVKR